MPFAATWIVILSEVSQTEKEKHCIISLTCGILKKTTTELTDTENRLEVARDGGWGMSKIDEGGKKAQTSSYKISPGDADVF